jgi:hypothetical protein
MLVTALDYADLALEGELDNRALVRRYACRDGLPPDCLR